jgi:hypothetical protein
MQRRKMAQVTPNCLEKTFSQTGEMELLTDREFNEIQLGGSQIKMNLQ